MKNDVNLKKAKIGDKFLIDFGAFSEINWKEGTVIKILPKSVDMQYDNGVMRFCKETGWSRNRQSILEPFYTLREIDYDIK